MSEGKDKRWEPGSRLRLICLAGGLLPMVAGCATNRPLEAIAEKSSCSMPLIVLVLDGLAKAAAEERDAFVIIELTPLRI